MKKAIDQLSAESLKAKLLRGESFKHYYHFRSIDTGEVCLFGTRLNIHYKSSEGIIIVHYDVYQVGDCEKYYCTDVLKDTENFIQEIKSNLKSRCTESFKRSVEVFKHKMSQLEG